MPNGPDGGARDGGARDGGARDGPDDGGALAGLNGLPYQVKLVIARKLVPFYIHTLGSSCSEWRAILRSNQRVLSNRRTLPGAGYAGDYSTLLPRFPNADTLRLYGNGSRPYISAFNLSSLGTVCTNGTAGPNGTNGTNGTKGPNGPKGAKGTVSSSGPRIRNLALALCTFVPSSFSSLESCDLTSLHLDTNFMHGVVYAIAPTISKMTSLVSLTILNNMIGASAATELARAVVGLTNLETLCLAHNELGATGATALAPSLVSLTRLRSLDLSRNLIACDGATALATALRALTELTELNIDANAIGAHGFASLDAAVRHSRGPQGPSGPSGPLGPQGLARLIGMR